MAFTQCECDAEYPSQTLAQLRAAVIAGLGFIAVPDALPRTLASLRTSILRRLGMADQVASAGTTALIEDFINEAQASVLRKYAYDAYGVAPVGVLTLVNDTDETMADGEAVFLLALANAKAHFEQDAKPYFEQFNNYLQDLFTRSPPNLTGVVDRLVREAQELLYRRYTVLHTERWFTWSMPAGERFYDLADNDEQTADPACTLALDPRRVTWVGVSQGDDQWRPLRCGIAPVDYIDGLTSIPEFYAIRQCIEIYPAPAESTWKLRVRGHFGLLPLSADTDTTTIDAQAITLMALANAKAHYKQPDAGNYMQQLNVYLGDLTAGTHATRRYFPGRQEPRNAIPPKAAS
jgi:hypothetical protein